MSDDWGNLEGGGRKGGRNWLGWGCGLGCLGLLLLGAVGIYGLKGFAEDFLNPASARGRLGELVAVEPPPGEVEAGGWTLQGGNKIPFIDFHAFVFMAEPDSEAAGLKAVLLVVDGEIPEGSFEGPDPGETFELEFRGEVLEAWRTSEVAPDSASKALGVALPTSVPERQMILVVDRQAGTEGGEPTEEQVMSLLGWFDIWPEPAAAAPLEGKGSAGQASPSEDPEPYEAVSPSGDGE